MDNRNQQRCPQCGNIGCGPISCHWSGIQHSKVLGGDSAAPHIPDSPAEAPIPAEAATEIGAEK